MYKNKAIGAVVATALLLVVAVFAIIGFQTWYNSYSSELFNNIETDTNIPTLVKVNDVIGDTLYVKSQGLNENEYIQEFKIKDKDTQIEVCTFDSLNEGLTGYYKLNGDVLDSSGNERNGIQNGGKFVEGINGKGIEFNSEDEYVRLDFADKYINKNQGTISVWFKSIGEPKISTFLGINQFENIISLPAYYGYSSMGIYWGNITDRGGTNNIGIIKSHTLYSISPRTITHYNKGEWTNIIWRHNDTTTFRVYKDGKHASNPEITSTTNSSGLNLYKLYLGGPGGNSKSVKGIIDEVRFYNRSLNDFEIKKIYNSVIKNGNLEIDLSDCNLDKNKEYNGVIVTDKQVINYEFYYN